MSESTEQELQPKSDAAEELRAEADDAAITPPTNVESDRKNVASEPEGFASSKTVAKEHSVESSEHKVPSGFFAAFKASPTKVKAVIAATLVAGVIAVVLSSKVIYTIVKIHRGERDPVQEVLETHRELATPLAEFTFSYELKNMSVALLNRSGTRTSYAQFHVAFDLPSAAAKETMELSRAKLRNTIFEVMSGFSLEDFRDSAGFERFRSKLLEHLKDDFGEAAPRGLAMKEWIVQ